MEREVRRFMWLMILITTCTAAVIGLLADDPALLIAAVASAVVNLVIMPRLARMWR